MGWRVLATPREGLRYDLAPCESTGEALGMAAKKWTRWALVVMQDQHTRFQKYSAREIRALPRGNPVGLTTAAVAA